MIIYRVPPGVRCFPLKPLTYPSSYAKFDVRMWFKLNQIWFAGGKAEIWDMKVYRTCHLRQLSPSPEKCQLSTRYLAWASVGKKISDVGDRGTPGYRREWQGRLARTVLRGSQEWDLLTG